MRELVYRDKLGNEISRDTLENCKVRKPPVLPMPVATV